MADDQIIEIPRGKSHQGTPNIIDEASSKEATINNNLPMLADIIKLKLADTPYSTESQDALEVIELFLRGGKKSLLILGDAASGKTNLCLELIKYLEKTALIYKPVYITSAELKKSRKLDIPSFGKKPILLIIDGYDELKEEYHYNFWRLQESNYLENVKILFTCRTHGVREKTIYSPEEDRQVRQAYQERLIEIFSPYTNGKFEADALEITYCQALTSKQVDDYIERFNDCNPLPTTESYVEHLLRLPDIKELMKNVFIMHSVLNFLPSLLNKHSEDLNLSGLGKYVKIREELYLQIEEMCYVYEKTKLIERDLITPEWADCIKEDFKKYNTELAKQIWKRGKYKTSFAFFPEDLNSRKIKNDANFRFLPPGCSNVTKTEEVVEKEIIQDNTELIEETRTRRYGYQCGVSQYLVEEISASQQMQRIQDSPLWYNITWQDSTYKPLSVLKRSALITCTEENIYQFLNFDLLSYFACKLMWSSQLHAANAAFTFDLNKQLLLQCPDFIQLERLFFEYPELENILWQVISESRKEKALTIAAANAATLLNEAGYSFRGKDLHKTHLRGANLQGVNASNANFEEADLREVNFTFANLSNTNLIGSCLDDIIWGEEISEAQIVGRLKKKFTSYIFSHDSLQIAGYINHLIYLVDSYTGETKVLNRHNNNIACIVYSDDSKKLASSDFKVEGGWFFERSEKICIWDTQSGQLLHEMKLPSNRVILTFTPKSLYMVSTNRINSDIQIWDVKVKKQFQSLNKIHGKIMTIAFNSNETISALLIDNEIVLYNLTNQSVYHKHSIEMCAYCTGCMERTRLNTRLMFNPNENLNQLLIISKNITVLDVKKGEKIQVIPYSDICAPYCLAFSLDGQVLATQERLSKEIIFRDTHTWQLRYKITDRNNKKIVFLKMALTC